MAATVTSSRVSGMGKHMERAVTEHSAKVPKGVRDMPKYTRVPSSSRPTPSTPAISGNMSLLA